MNSRQIHLPEAHLTTNEGVVSEIGQERADASDLMTDKLLLYVRLIWGIKRVKDRRKCGYLVTATIGPLFYPLSTNLERHERGVSFSFMFGKS